MKLQLYLASMLALPIYPLTISPGKAHAIGNKIWQNECHGSVSGLTTWNEGEPCASMGIGHFIWYPAHKRDRYHETFPELLRFLQQQHINLPAWLTTAPSCPWPNRTTFYRDIDSPRMRELRALLARTVNEQALFITKRFEETVANITKNVSPREAQHITSVINQLSASPQGLYAMIDYLNFKGAGIDPAERYHGKGWGLAQVLLATKPQTSDYVAAFSAAAKKVLTQRVHNAPKERYEEKWLRGWIKRVASY